MDCQSFAHTLKGDNMKRFSMEFGKKEKVLNYTSNTYQLTRPNKVGEVMALIRECQPNTYEEWEEWYFENAVTKSKNQFKITKESLFELGERLYEKIIEVVIPEWQTAFNELTKDDCVDYIYNLVINRTYDGYVREKSVVNDNLANRFPEVTFEESDAYMDHACDIDYIGRINGKSFGLQIKPMTNRANFGNYSPTERMKASFKEFEKENGGGVFIVYSLDGDIGNTEVIQQIADEIVKLKG